MSVDGPLPVAVCPGSHSVCVAACQLLFTCLSVSRASSVSFCPFLNVYLALPTCRFRSLFLTIYCCSVRLSLSDKERPASGVQSALNESAEKGDRWAMRESAVSWAYNGHLDKHALAGSAGRDWLRRLLQACRQILFARRRGHRVCGHRSCVFALHTRSTAPWT